MDKPCDTCKRVADPEDCKRDTCIPWMEWFLWAWDQARLAALLKILNTQEKK